uniref:sirohydrochlorin cobaltochelatase n=1 Tax=Dissulfurimicrobium sp. TaxID=2022436 RepID=UPI00404B1C94
MLTAFGTTSRAMKTYAVMDKALKICFPGHDIHWAYTSRMVKDVARKEGRDIKSLSEVMDELAIKGHLWAVVQSLHILCGHEFYRMLDEIRNCSIRISVGLPLLVASKDYERLADAIYITFPEIDHEAVVLVGHGTDHPAWSSYLAFSWVLRRKFGRRFFIGVIEDGRPTRDETIAAVKESGFTKVRLVPLMLVAGRHFHEDMIGETDSWKTTFEQKGMDVLVHPDGLGELSGIIEIFCDHIQDALAVIP